MKTAIDSIPRTRGRARAALILLPALLLAAHAARGGSLDAFPDGDFEATSSHGKMGEFGEAGRGLGVNGGGGVRVAGFKVHSFRLKTRPGLALAKGQRYLFSLDTCAKGKVIEQIAMEVYSKENGRYLQGFWGRSITDIGGGWNREELSFVPSTDLGDSVDMRFILHVQLPKGVEPGDPANEVFCDNARLRGDDPQWLFCNTWPTHNTIHKETGRVRAHTSFVGPFLPADSKPTYTFELSAPGGKPFARAAAKLQDGVLTAAFGPLSRTGDAVLTAILSDRGKVVAKRERNVTIAPKRRPQKGEIEITENGIALVDGKPFMPLGFYSDLAYADRHAEEEVEKRLAELESAGFNFLIDYGSYTLKTKERRDFFYGACQRHRIRVMPDDFAGLAHATNGIAECGARAKELAAYPAIIGWYTMDEASQDKVPVVERIRRELNQATPGLVVNTCNIMEPALYLPTADVQGGDTYPIDSGDRDLRGTSSYLRGAAACRAALAWYAPQAFNWASTRTGGDTQDEAAYLKLGREPEENEILSVALLQASWGVRGFIFYSLFDMARAPSPAWRERRWQRMVNVGAAMRSLEPFIMSGEPIRECTHADVKGETRIVALADGKGAYRILLIGLGRDNEATLKLPPALSRLRSRCGLTQGDGVNRTFAGREFTCDILE